MIDPLGDAWRARIRLQHERHAGIPDFGWCPLDDNPAVWPFTRSRRHPGEVRMVTPAMLRGQRDVFRAMLLGPAATAMRNLYEASKTADRELQALEAGRPDDHITGEDDPSVQHEHPYRDEMHLGGES